jgi:muramoyltetrapeptide carboxypeptidase
MIQPPFLKQGDAIYLLSTARSVTHARANQFAEWLQDKGYRVIFGKTIGPTHHQFAGNDQLRGEDFCAALDDPSVKAIWCMRGGYGSVRMMKYVDEIRVRKAQKWLLGFSDVTILHGYFQRCGLMSLHAPMGALFHQTDERAFTSTLKRLEGASVLVPAVSHALTTITTLKGRVLGGNLSMLYSMHGSKYMPEPNGNDVLFIEEIDEYLYHIDRMMWALRNNGWIQSFSAWAIGGLTDMNDHKIPFGSNAEEIIREHADELGIPVLFGVCSGHMGANYPILLGGENVFCGEKHA